MLPLLAKREHHVASFYKVKLSKSIILANYNLIRHVDSAIQIANEVAHKLLRGPETFIFVYKEISEARVEVREYFFNYSIPK